VYIKIYFNDKPLFLCDSIDDVIQPHVHHDDAIFIDELNAHTVKTMIHEMQQPQVHAGVFYHADLDELRKAFQKKFTVVRAAGGLVRNEYDQILMIFRRGRWDFPKGKLDKGEKLEDCAVREVEEETGLRNVKLLFPLTVTCHTYHEGTRHILKESHWFSMTVAGEQNLTPQAEEDISDLKWIDKKELNSYVERTFPLISDIIQSAKENEFIVF
jgi:8-oxo-dGTP pyrophosphatase MutT (NUDIX family)